MAESAAVAVAVLAAVVDGAVVVVGAAAEAAGVELPNRFDVEAGAVVVFAPLNKPEAADEDGAALVVGAGLLTKAEDCAGAEAGVGVVADATEAGAKRDGAFGADAAVLAGVEPPSPGNSPPVAGVVLAAVPEAAEVVVLGANKLPALPEAGVDSAGLVAAAPPKRPVDGALGAPLPNRPPAAGFGAVVEAAVLLNKVDPELLAGCVDGVLENSVLAPPNKAPAGFGSAA